MNSGFTGLTLGRSGFICSVVNPPGICVFIVKKCFFDITSIIVE